MRNFVIGVFVTLALLLVGGYGFLKLGVFPVHADTPAGGLETWLANVGRDAAVGRAATKEPNPMSTNDENLLKGMHVYMENCQGCHGGSDSSARMGRNLYPRAPQFGKRSPNEPDAELFWIVKHGIRLTGMPAYGSEQEPMLTVDEIWRVVLFVKSTTTLPPAVLAEWKTPAALPTPAPVASPAPMPAGAGPATP